MREKQLFTRDAFRPTFFIKERPPLVHQKYVKCDLSVLFDQFTHISLKYNWKLFSRQGQVYVESPLDKVSLIMEAVEGDESPYSYIQAVSLYHQLSHYCPKKDTNVELNMIVDQDWIRSLDLFGYWSFGNPGRSLNPLFFYDSLLHPVVIFFTHHKEGMERINKNIHRFDHSGYTLKYHQRTWAIINNENYSC